MNSDLVTDTELSGSIYNHTMTVSLEIAFTYDSKADCLARGWTEEQASSYSSSVFIDSVAESLTRLGHNVIHVSHLQNLARRLVAGEAKTWDLVFNISEGVFGIAKGVQIPALLEAYRVPYTFSDPASRVLAMDKAMTKMVLQNYNIPTSPFIIIQSFERSQFGDDNLQDWTTAIEERLKAANLELSMASPLFIKPAAEDGSSGIDHRSRVTTIERLVIMVKELHQRFPNQSFVIEKYANGREFTVSIIGTAHRAKVLGVMEFRKIKRGTIASDEQLCAADNSDEENVDFATYKVKSVATANFFELLNVTHETSDEVREVGRIALAAFRALGCRDLGRIDIRSFGFGLDARPQILEVNSIPGLRPDNSHTPILAEQEGWKYDELIAELLSQTIQRYGGYEGITALRKARQLE